MPEEKIVENSVEDFAERFNTLGKEAAGYGISSMCAIVEVEMFGENENKHLSYTGGMAQAIGLAEWAKHVLLKDACLQSTRMSESEDDGA